MEIIIMVNFSLCLFLQDFETNSFEQMCINFANETLQFFFNQFVFRMEQVSVTLQYYASHQKFILGVCHARQSVNNHGCLSGGWPPGSIHSKSQPFFLVNSVQLGKVQ